MTTQAKHTGAASAPEPRVGRTTYVPKDAGWWRRSRVVELGQEFGPAGPAVLDWLTCEARTQGPIRGHDGTVKTGYAAVAYGCFLQSGADEASDIIEKAVELELLDDFEESGRTFTCRISGWRADVNSRLESASRAERRARTSKDDDGQQEDNPADVRECPPASAEVPPEGEVEGEVEGERTSSLRSDVQRARDVDEWPAELPESLREVAEHVHKRLLALAERKKGADPSKVTRRRIGAVVADFPEHDHRTVVGGVCDYWLDGKGAKTERKDFALVYRERCGHVVPSAPRPNGGGPRRTSSDAVVAFANRGQEAA